MKFNDKLSPPSVGAILRGLFTSSIVYASLSAHSAEPTRLDDYSWRIMSKIDRGTVGRSSNGMLQSGDYLGNKTQHWRFIKRNDGFYDIESDHNQECITSSENQVNLYTGACDSPESAWIVEEVRQHSEEKPALYLIYKHLSSVFTYGAQGPKTAPCCGNTIDNVYWYIEQAGFDRPKQPAEYEISALLLVKTKTDVSMPEINVSGEGTIDAEVYEGAKYAFEVRAAQWMSDITDGRVQWNGTTQISHEPIRTLQPNLGHNTFERYAEDEDDGTFSLWNDSIKKFEPAPAGFDPTRGTIDKSDDYERVSFLPGPTELANDVQRYVPQGIYDTVQVLFTGGNLFGGGGTGGAGSVASNHTLWTNINTSNATGAMWKSPLDVFLVELYLHEPMHGFDGTYMNEPSISLPDGHLHGATGYKYNMGPNGWKHWFRDYWLGTVIGPDDTYSGYGNALFQLPRPREIAADKTSTTTRIFQRSSGKCLTSQSGSSWPQSNERLVFSSICDTEASKFTLQDNGVLKHEASGMCVHPLGGEAFQENIRLVFWPTCPEFEQIKLEITDDSSIRSLYSNRCVYPFGGLSNPAEGTEAVFHSGCASENIQFIFKRY